MKQHGIEYVGCSLADCDDAISYDEVLVNTFDLNEKDDDNDEFEHPTA